MNARKNTEVVTLKAIYALIKYIGVRANVWCPTQGLFIAGVGQSVRERSTGNRPAFIRSQSVRTIKLLQMEIRAVSDIAL